MVRSGYAGKFNVKLNIIPDPDGVYETRMESGNLGDIVIWGNDSDEYQQAVQKGMLFDWNEDDILTDYGPYIKEHMPYALEKMQTFPAVLPMDMVLMWRWIPAPEAISCIPGM